MSVSTVEDILFLPGPIGSRAVRVPTVLAIFCLVSTGTRDWTSFTSLDKRHRTDTVGDILVRGIRFTAPVHGSNLHHVLIVIYAVPLALL